MYMYDTTATQILLTPGTEWILSCLGGSKLAIRVIKDNIGFNLAVRSNFFKYLLI